MNTVIKTVDLVKKYGTYEAVNHINLTINKGDIYGLVGKNGAGKSTLFKMLMGISTATGGSIELFGKNGDSDLIKERKHIGFMIGSNFFPYLNAEENLEYFSKIKGIYDQKELLRVLELVGLGNVKKPYKSYSLGMKQRLGIANAIFGTPKLVILDEPVNGLDPEGIVEFRNLILKLNKEEGITFLVSSHILGELGLMSNRFGFIDGGKLIKEITQEELIKNSKTTLCIKTPDLERALQIFKNELNYTNSRIDKDKIYIKSENFNINLIAKTMIDNELYIEELSQEVESLETYFLKLTGGSGHAKLR